MDTKREVQRARYKEASERDWERWRDRKKKRRDEMKRTREDVLLTKPRSTSGLGKRRGKVTMATSCRKYRLRG